MGATEDAMMFLFRELTVDEPHEFSLATNLFRLFCMVLGAVSLWACVYSGCYSIG